MKTNSRSLYLDNLKLFPILLGLQYTFDKVWMGNMGKFLFLGALTCCLSFGLTRLLRLIPGVKKVL